MQLGAFLLSTGLMKMDQLSDYFDCSSMLITKIITRHRFDFLAATFSEN